MNSAGLLEEPVGVAYDPYKFRKPPREINGLIWAEFDAKGPNYKNTHLKGSAAKGKAYERRFLKWLQAQTGPWEAMAGAELFPNRWIRFEDANGYGYAQPDCVALAHGFTWIFECKLTHHPHARTQLMKLYSPLIARVLPKGGPHLLVEVAHNLGSGDGGQAPDCIIDLDSVLEKDREIHLLHWL